MEGGDTWAPLRPFEWVSSGLWSGARLSQPSVRGGPGMHLAKCPVDESGLWRSPWLVLSCRTAAQVVEKLGVPPSVCLWG